MIENSSGFVVQTGGENRGYIKKEKLTDSLILNQTEISVVKKPIKFFFVHELDRKLR